VRRGKLWNEEEQIELAGIKSFLEYGEHFDMNERIEAEKDFIRDGRQIIGLCFSRMPIDERHRMGVPPRSTTEAIERLAVLRSIEGERNYPDRADRQRRERVLTPYLPGGPHYNPAEEAAFHFHELRKTEAARQKQTSPLPVPSARKKLEKNVEMAKGRLENVQQMYENRLDTMPTDERGRAQQRIDQYRQEYQQLKAELDRFPRLVQPVPPAPAPENTYEALQRLQALKYREEHCPQFSNGNDKLIFDREQNREYVAIAPFLYSRIRWGGVRFDEDESIAYWANHRDDG